MGGNSAKLIIFYAQETLLLRKMRREVLLRGFGGYGKITVFDELFRRK